MLGGNLRKQVVGIAGILVVAGILRRVVGRTHGVDTQGNLRRVVEGIHVAADTQGILRVVGGNILEVEVLDRLLQADGVRGLFGAAAVVGHRRLDTDRE